MGLSCSQYRDRTLLESKGNAGAVPRRVGVPYTQTFRGHLSPTLSIWLLLLFHLCLSVELL